MTPLYERGNAAKQWIFEELHRQFGDRAARVLDVGCGDGAKWPLFLEAHLAMQVTGLDIDAAAIARGAAHVARVGGGRLSLRVADVQKPIADAVFDAVVAFSAIEHVVDHKAFLATVWNALAAGGVAYLNYDDGHFRSSNLKERLMVPVSQLLALVGVEGSYMKHVDDAAFRAFAEAQGFCVQAFRKHNMHPLKGFLRKGPDEAVRAWMAFEEQLGTLYPPDVLDRVMWSSTLVLQKSL